MLGGGDYCSTCPYLGSWAFLGLGFPKPGSTNDLEPRFPNPKQPAVPRAQYAQLSCSSFTADYIWFVKGHTI